MGDIVFNISGGAPNYTVLLSGYGGSWLFTSAGEKTLHDIPTGTYTLTVTDSLGCECVIGGIIIPATTTSTTTSISTTTTTTECVYPTPFPEINGEYLPCASSTEEYYVDIIEGHSYLWEVIGGTISGSSTESTVNIIWGETPMVGNLLSLTETVIEDGCSIKVHLYIYLNVPIDVPGIGILDDPVCGGNETSVTLDTSYVGTTYRLRDDSDNSQIGNPVPGTGSALQFPTGLLTTSMTFNIIAITDVGNCPLEMSNTIGVTVNASPASKTFNVTGDNPVCAGETSELSVYSTQVGVSYQLRNDADDSNIGASQGGTGGTLVFSSGILSITTTFNILATLADCTLQMANTPTITVNPLPVITDQPDNLILCEGESGYMSVVTSAPAPTYQWQVYTGEEPPDDWANLDEDSPTMTGVTLATLSFFEITEIYLGTAILRCVVTSGGCSTPSDSATLTVNECTTTTTIP